MISNFWIMTRFFWVILLHHCFIATCVDPTFGGDLPLAKISIEAGDHTLNRELSTPNHLDLFPEIETSLDESKAESPGGSKSEPGSGGLPSATSNEIRDTETSASDPYRAKYRGMPGTDSEESKRKVSKPYERDGQLRTSPLKKHPQGHASRGPNGPRSSRRKILRNPYAHPSQGSVPGIPIGHIQYLSTAPLPQPEGWIPFFSNSDDAARWLKAGQGYGQFHTFPLQTPWEPSYPFHGSHLGHEMYPAVDPQTTNLHQYNIHGQPDHDKVTSNWAQKSIHAPPFVSTGQDKSHSKDIASAHDVQLKNEEPQEVKRTDILPPADATSSLGKGIKLNANARVTAENSALQSMQKLLHPQDNKHHRSEISGSDAIDTHKSTGETPSNIDASHPAVDDRSPEGKALSKDQELGKDAAKTASLPTQQSLDHISSKASYKSIALTGIKSTTESNSKLGTRVADTSRTSPEILRYERQDANEPIAKSTFPPKPVDQFVKGVQSSARRIHPEIKMKQNDVPYQTGDIKLNVLKGEKKQQILRSNHFFPDEEFNSGNEPPWVPGRFNQDSKDSISSEWIRVKTKNRGAQKSSAKTNMRSDTPPSQHPDISEGLMTHQRKLAMDAKGFAASRDSTFELLKDHASSEAQETVIPKSSTEDMQGSDSSETFSDESTPVDSAKGVFEKSVSANDRVDVQTTFQTSKRSKTKKKPKKPQASASINKAEVENEINVSAHKNDDPENPRRGDSSETDLKSLLAKVLQYDNLKDNTEISLTQKDFEKILSKQDDLVSLGLFPEAFGERWVKAALDLGENAKNAREIYRRMNSLKAQYSQKLILKHWRMYKSALSQKTQEAFLYFKVDQEWPTFYNADLNYLMVTKAKLESLDQDSSQILHELLFDKYLDSRLATLYMMATMPPQEKIFTEQELVSLSKSGGSIPALLEIFHQLELSTSEVNWNTYTKDQILEKLRGLKLIMMGKYDMQPGLQLDVDDLVWVTSTTRAFILESRFSGAFTNRLRSLAKTADKVLPKKTAKEWMPGHDHLWEDQTIGQGEALVAAHFSMDIKGLAILKRLIERQNKKPPPGVGKVIYWPGTAPDEMKQHIKLFAEFFGFQGLRLVVN